MGLKDLNLNSVKADSRLLKDLPEATADFCTMNECYNLLISLALLHRFGYVRKSARRSAFKLLLICGHFIHVFSTVAFSSHSFNAGRQGRPCISWTCFGSTMRKMY